MSRCFGECFADLYWADAGERRSTSDRVADRLRSFSRNSEQRVGRSRQESRPARPESVARISFRSRGVADGVDARASARRRVAYALSADARFAFWGRFGRRKYPPRNGRAELLPPRPRCGRCLTVRISSVRGRAFGAPRHNRGESDREGTQCARYPVFISDDAGGYLCNAVLYHSLRARRSEKGDAKSGSHISLPTYPNPREWRKRFRSRLRIIKIALEPISKRASLTST